MEPSHPVMIISADPIQIALVRQALADSNFGVVAAGRGDSALADFSQVAPALVLVDWSLPDMSALTVTRAIRNRPGFAKVPVVLMAQEIGVENKILALEVGVDYCYEGKISPRELTARVRALLRRAREG